MHGNPWNDVRLAALRLLRTPAFSAVIVGMIGIAVATVLTIGTAASGLLWQSLPYPDGDRLVFVEGFAAQMNSSIGFAPGLLGDLESMPQVEAVGGYDSSPPLYSEDGVAFDNARIEPALIDLLAARPLHGRLLTVDDPADAVMLSESVWRARFGGDPDIVGTSVDFDGVRLNVVGVAAGEFRFPSRETALWRPLHLTPAQRSGADAYNFGAVQTVARLRSGVQLREFSVALAALGANRPELAPMRQFMGLTLRATSLRERWDGGRSAHLTLLVVAASAVLLLLLANVGSLWLSRCLQRARELAVRSALGATPRRIAQELIHEVVLVSVTAVALGLLAVPPGLRALEWFGVLDAGTPLLPAPGLATGAAALAVVALLVATLSLAPVWIARHPQTRSLLAQGMRAAGASRGAQRARRGLVALQIALAVSLLCGAGLLTRSLWQLLDQDVGFRPENVTLARIEPRQHAADGSAEAASAALPGMIAQLAAIPGVQAVGVAETPPFSFGEAVGSVKLDLAGEVVDFSVRDRPVSGDYFGALGMAVERGRLFARDDANRAAPGVIVDSRFVAAHLRGAEPLGLRIGLPTDGEDGATRWGRIVGVVPSVRHMQLEEVPEQGTIYRFQATPLIRHHATALVIRSNAGSADLARQLRAAAAEAGLRATDIVAMSARMRETLSHRLPLASLISIFAVLGGVLAAVGLFALVAFSVQQRTAEFGLRLALGAPPASLQRLALREGVIAAWPGLVAGLVGALAVGQLLASRLYQVSASDPVTLAAVLLAAAVLVLCACLLPARRAVRTDPAATLRHD